VRDRPSDAVFFDGVSESSEASDSAGLLLVGDSDAVLKRIVASDRLGLRALLVGELRRRAFLFDIERLLERLFAVVAYRAVSWRGEPRLSRFLRDCTREAIESALEDPDSGPANGPSALVHQDVFMVLARPLGLAPQAMRVSCAAFNRRDPLERELFVRILLEGASPDAVATERALAVLEVLRGLRRTIDDLVEGVPAPTIPPMSFHS